MKSFLLILLLTKFLVCFDGASSLQCVDENGVNVDWAILYKLPKQENKRQSGFVHEGLGYVYFTSTSPQSGWKLSNHSINDLSSLPGRILAPLFNTDVSKNILFALYNDEHPDGHTSFTDGHTKGVVAFDQNEGFWLVHSVPHFPPNTENNGKYGYPHTGQRYGQSFLCISLKTDASANIIGGQLLYNHPYMYSINIPEWATKEKFPDFIQATKGKHIKKPPYFKTVQLESLKGVSFTSFAKYTLFHKDLYADFVAPFLQSNLLTETWPNGPGKMKSSCDTKFQVENIDELDFDLPGEKDDEDFTTRHDHAKWAVTKDKTSNGRKFVCIGDINRMKSQMKRAGGTVCFNNHYVWKAFTGIIKSVEKCQ